MLPHIPLGLAIDGRLGRHELASAIAWAGTLGLDRVELDGRTVEAWLGAPVPTVPLEPVPADALDLGLLEIEADVLTDAYDLARRSFETRRRDWRIGVSLAPLEALRRDARRVGVAIDVLTMPGLTRWSDAELDYVGRVGRALGARILAGDATADDPGRLARAARRFELEPTVFVPTSVDTALTRRLAAQPATAIALNLLDPPDGWHALPETLAAHRLTHVRVGGPDRAVADTLAAWSDRAAADYFVAISFDIVGTGAAADAVAAWRRLLTR